MLFFVIPKLRLQIFLFLNFVLQLAPEQQLGLNFAVDLGDSDFGGIEFGLGGGLGAPNGKVVVHLLVLHTGRVVQVVDHVDGHA